MLTSYDHLPSNVLTLSGYDFFQFIKSTLGENEAILLNKISVRTTSSLMVIEDPLEIFNQDVEDQELDELKEILCFKMKNENFFKRTFQYFPNGKSDLSTENKLTAYG